MKKVEKNHSHKPKKTICIITSIDFEKNEKMKQTHILDKNHPYLTSGAGKTAQSLVKE